MGVSINVSCDGCGRNMELVNIYCDDCHERGDVIDYIRANFGLLPQDIKNTLMHTVLCPLTPWAGNPRFKTPI